ncbi:MAG: metal-dependent hydrolase [Acidobacteria bacterium]|nr:metal-dependent hydrolase [Acidobacteriota bacterium]
MDSITQGILGAAAAQAVLKKRLPRGAGVIGAVGGVIPDLDVIIHSFNDPTVGWVFHRHFTHSLFFIPFGGFLAALPFLFMPRFRDHKREVILAAIIGYATHAPLDMFTSYGTQMFWPFSNYRVKLDWIGIVDPVYSIPLAIGVFLTMRTLSMRPVRIALLLTSLYICFGGWQHHRGVVVQQRLAESRGHRIEYSRVMPAPGWLVMWRSVYVSNGRLYSDGIQANWFRSPRVLPGASADMTTFADLPVNAQANPETRRRFEIFHWFADGLIAPIPGEMDAYGDMRITSEVESLSPLWGLKFNAVTGEALRWSPSATQTRDVVGILRGLVLGDDRYRPLSELEALDRPRKVVN